jgi:hypothetical protein
MRVGASLSHDKKALWPPFPFHIGDYGIKDSSKKQLNHKAHGIPWTTFHFGEEKVAEGNDPLEESSKATIEYHVCKYRWPYQNEVW